MPGDEIQLRPRWLAGLVVGVAVGLFFGFAGPGDRSALSSVAVGGLWGSVFFFQVADPQWRKAYGASKALRGLTATQRKAYREARRNCSVPDDPDVRRALLSMSTHDASPGVLERAQVWVMSGWVALCGVFIVIDIADGDASRLGGSALFLLLPALFLGAVLIRRAARRRSRRILDAYLTSGATP